MYKIASLLVVVAVMLSACYNKKDMSTGQNEDSIKIEESAINYSWDELSYEEYLQEAMDEKGLKEEELQTLKYMGFSRAEIQAMTKEQARKHLKAWNEFVEKYHDNLKTKYFSTIENWEDTARKENLVWTDGEITVNPHLISDFISEMSKGNAKLLILYINRIYSLNFESGKGIMITVYSQDGTKEKISCEGVEEQENGYLLKGTDIMIYK